MSQARSRACQSQNRPFLPYRLPRRKQWQQRTPTLLKCFSRDEKVLGEKYTHYTKLMSRSCHIGSNLRCKISFQKHSCLVQFFFHGITNYHWLWRSKIRITTKCVSKKWRHRLNQLFFGHCVAKKMLLWSLLCGLSFFNIYSGFRMNSTFFIIIFWETPNLSMLNFSVNFKKIDKSDTVDKYSRLAETWAYCPWQDETDGIHF